MELVHRIHLDPLRRNLEFAKELASKGGRVSQERVEMCSRVEQKTLAAKTGTKAAESIVFFHNQDAHAAAAQQIGAHQAADPGADHDGIVVSRVDPAEDDVRLSQLKPPSTVQTCPVTYAPSSA